MDLAQAIEIKALANLVDQLDYYQILKVERSVRPGELKRAYYREKSAFHPDRFYHLEDQELKECVHKIAKRITEAYAMLKDHDKRAHYDKGLDAPGEARRLRYTEHSEKEQKQAKKEEIGTTEKGRKAYAQGMMAMKQGNYETAERHFKMALAWEPANEFFKAKMKEAGKNIKVDFRIK